MIIANNNIVGYWDFSEGSGSTLYDYSGNGNNLTISGATWDKVSKQKQYALDFDGVDDILSMASATDFEVANLSVSFLCKPNAEADANYLISFGRALGSPYYGWHIILQASTNKLNIFTGKADSPYYNNMVTTGTLTDGVWNHVVVTFNGSSFNIYINNASPETFAGAAIAYNASYRTFKIGDRANSTGFYFNGNMSNIKIYDRAISADEVAALYRQTYRE